MSTTLALASLWTNFKDLIPRKVVTAMLKIDANTLWNIAPLAANDTQRARQEAVILPLGMVLADTLDRYEINTPHRIAHFLAQACHESDGFRTLVEYASGAAYEGRGDLGNVNPGDGARFKGRGIFELTGRDNYNRYGHLLGIDLANNPQLASRPVTSLLIACEYWKQRHINRLADQDDIWAVTRAINGGTNGITFRAQYTSKAKMVLARMQVADLGTVQTDKDARPILARGDNGEAVYDLQNLLRLRGIPLAMDGDFGAATETAVRLFQRNNTLKDDGVAGGQTWAKLETGK